MSLTIKDTLDRPNIKSVFKGENAPIAYGVARVLVSRFMDSFGFATKMNDSQIDTLTVDTLEYFSFETVEDLILFFKMARQGKLGATNRGVDSNLIFSTWLPVYLDKKAEIRELEYQKQKISKSQISIEEVRNSYKKQMNSGQKYWDKIKERVDKLTEGFNRDQLESLISEWEKDESKTKFLDVLRRKRLDIKGDYKF